MDGKHNLNKERKEIVSENFASGCFLGRAFGADVRRSKNISQSCWEVTFAFCMPLNFPSSCFTKSRRVEEHQRRRRDRVKGEQATKMERERKIIYDNAFSAIVELQMWWKISESILISEDPLLLPSFRPLISWIISFPASFFRTFRDTLVLFYRISDVCFCLAVMNKFVLCINENENVLLLMLFWGRWEKLGSEQERKCIQFHIRRESDGEREREFWIFLLLSSRGALLEDAFLSLLYKRGWFCSNVGERWRRNMATRLRDGRQDDARRRS